VVPVPVPTGVDMSVNLNINKNISNVWSRLNPIKFTCPKIWGLAYLLFKCSNLYKVGYPKRVNERS
jgi:hypothetical protein